MKVQRDTVIFVLGLGPVQTICTFRFGVSDFSVLFCSGEAPIAFEHSSTDPQGSGDFEMFESSGHRRWTVVGLIRRVY